MAAMSAVLRASMTDVILAVSTVVNSVAMTDETMDSMRVVCLVGRKVVHSVDVMVDL